MNTLVTTASYLQIFVLTNPSGDKEGGFFCYKIYAIIKKTAKYHNYIMLTFLKKYGISN